jgi:predicted acyltransferase
MLLGAHNYVKGPEGYDPEGLLGTLPAIAHGLIGVAVGEYLLRGDQLRERRLAAAGLAMLAVGGSWSLAFPVVKDIWSSTFVLVTCGLTSLLLAALLATFDEGQPLVGWRKAVSIVLLPFGMNAIAAYVLHELAGSMLGWDLLLVPYRQACSVVPPQVAAFVPVLLFIAFIWACMDYLRRKGWIIKI